MKKLICFVILSTISFTTSASLLIPKQNMNFLFFQTNEYMQWKNPQLEFNTPNKKGKFNGLISWIDSKGNNRSSTIRGRLIAKGNGFVFRSPAFFKTKFTGFIKPDDTIQGIMFSKRRHNNASGLFNSAVVNLPTAGLLMFSALGVILISGFKRR